MSNNSTKDNKKYAVDAAIAQIERLHGKGSIMRHNTIVNISCFSTGSMKLDIALGGKGFPKGRIVEIYGPESSGKTTLALHAIAAVQKTGGICVFVDAEHALDPIYAKKLGVNIQELIISQPDTGEQALEIVDTMVRSGGVSLVVIDSVAALTPKAEIEGDMGDAHMGLHARLMSQALRKLTASVNRTQCMIIFINQIRMKIGVIFGNPETTTGGNALKFYASIRLDIRKVGIIKDKDKIVGHQVKVKVVKNKIAPPFQIVELEMIYEEGISQIAEIIDLAVQSNIINKSGSWFDYQDKKIGQGKENVKLFLQDNPDIMVEIKKAIREHYNMNDVVKDSK